MSPDAHPISRRNFLAVTSAGLVAGALNASGAVEASRPAIEGGAKAVPSPLPQPERWGVPERDRLASMVEQKSLFYWRGPQTTALVERFRKTCPLPHVMTCSSGTAALHIAVAAAGIGPGDEVITTPVTDMGTVIGILYQQGVPVFADVDPHSYNLDPADVKRKITPRTKAIIAVHLAGNPAALAELRDLADAHQLVLIEDCAQAWGTRYRGKPTGTLGHIGCFSLQDSKQVSCGDGGIVASGDERFGPLLQQFGDKGFDRLNPTAGFGVLAPNYRMSEPQAAVAAAQLDRVEDIAARRAELGTQLTGHLRGLPGITPHGVDPSDRATYYFYMLRMDPAAFRCDRAQLVKALRAEGVPASAGYIATPLHRFDVFQNHNFFNGRWPVRELGLTSMDYRKVTCPVSEAVLETCIRVVINQAMDSAYIRAVGEGFQKVARHFARAR